MALEAAGEWRCLASEVAEESLWWVLAVVEEHCWRGTGAAEEERSRRGTVEVEELHSSVPRGQVAT